MGSISAKWAISACVSSQFFRTRPQRSAPVPSSSSPNTPYIRNHKGSGQNSRTLYHSTRKTPGASFPVAGSSPPDGFHRPTLPRFTSTTRRHSSRSLCLRQHPHPHQVPPPLPAAQNPTTTCVAHRTERKSRLPRQLAPDPIPHPNTTRHRHASRRATTSHNDHPRRPPHHFHLAATYWAGAFFFTHLSLPSPIARRRHTPP
jgi:hypothetical protein